MANENQRATTGQIDRGLDLGRAGSFVNAVPRGEVEQQPTRKPVASVAPEHEHSDGRECHRAREAVGSPNWFEPGWDCLPEQVPRATELYGKSSGFRIDRFWIRAQ